MHGQIGPLETSDSSSTTSDLCIVETIPPIRDNRRKPSDSPGRSRRRKIDGDGHDFYPTPLWAVLALLDREHFKGPIWECACGDGEAAIGLSLRGYDVIASDLVDRGYGNAGIDFLTMRPNRPFGTIFTNPPFKDAEAFARRARSFAGKSVAMFMPLQFLQSAGRAAGLWQDDPPDRILVVPDRVTMYPRGHERPESGTHATAWYIWDGHPAKPGRQPPIGWLAPGAHKHYGAATQRLRAHLLERHAMHIAMHRA